MLLPTSPWTRVKTEPLFFYLSIFGFFIGVAGASTLPALVNTSVAFFLFFISCVSFFFWWYKTHEYFLHSLIFCLFISLGILRAFLFFENIPVLPNSYIGQSVTLFGQISGGVEKREGNTRFIIETEEISGQKLKEKTPILVFASPETNVSRGQILRIKGVLKNPETFLSSSSQIPFDWPSYLRAKKILYTLSFPQIELVENEAPRTSPWCPSITTKPEGLPVGRNPAPRTTSSASKLMVLWCVDDKNFLSFLDEVKNNFSEKIERVLPKPESSFLLGVLVGTNPGSKDMEDSFRKAGLLHVLVLSGYNIAIIIWAVISFFYFLSRRKALLLGMVAAILFIAMVGPTAPLLRAIIMAFCAVLAEFLGGAAVASRTAWVAAFILVLFSPGLLIFDPSFQLSFLATLGLVYGVPFLKKRSVFSKIPFLLKEIVITTISAQFFVVPALLFYTGRVTPYFLLANAIILPLIPIIMFLGFFLVILGFIWPFSVFLVTVPLFILLKFSLSFIALVASFPGALFFIGSFPGIFVFLLYLAFFVLCVRRTEFPPNKTLNPLLSIKETL